MQFANSPTRDKYPLSHKKIIKKTISGSLAVFLGFGIFMFFVAEILFQSPISPAATSTDYPLGAIIEGFFVAVIVIWTIGIYIYQKWYFDTYFYDILPDHITIRKGVFTKREINLPYERIQDVYVDQDLFDRVLGLYDVHLSTATVSSVMEAHIDGVEQTSAQGLKNDLLGLLMEKIHPNSPTTTSPVASSIPNPSNEQSPTVNESTYGVHSRWVIQNALVLPTAFLLIVIFIFLSTINRHTPPFNNQLINLNYVAWLIVIIMYYLIAIPLALFYSILYKRNFHYSLNPQFLTIKSGVINIQERQVPWSSIQDVSVTRSFLDLLMGLATVKVQNATQSVGDKSNLNAMLIFGLKPSDAESLKTLLLDKALQGRNESSRSGL